MLLARTFTFAIFCCALASRQKVQLGSLMEEDSTLPCKPFMARYLCQPSQWENPSNRKCISKLCRMSDVEIDSFSRIRPACCMLAGLPVDSLPVSKKSGELEIRDNSSSQHTFCAGVVETDYKKAIRVYPFHLADGSQCNLPLVDVWDNGYEWRATTAGNINIVTVMFFDRECEIFKVGDYQHFEHPKVLTLDGVGVPLGSIMGVAERLCADLGAVRYELQDASHTPCLKGEANEGDLLYDPAFDKKLRAMGTHIGDQLLTLEYRTYLGKEPLYQRYGFRPCKIGDRGKWLWTSGVFSAEEFLDAREYVATVTVGEVQLEASKSKCKPFYKYTTKIKSLRKVKVDAVPALGSWVTETADESGACELDETVGSCFLKHFLSGSRESCKTQAEVQARLMHVHATHAAGGEGYRLVGEYSLNVMKQECPIAIYSGIISSAVGYCKDA